MKSSRRIGRPSNLTILLLGLNAIALTVLILVVIDRSPSPPARPASWAEAGLPAGWIKPWFRPLTGPWRIAIQVGHMKNLELPTELRHLRGNDGAIVNKVMEWQINQKVAAALAKRLAGPEVEVLVLPATVPPGLRVDAFIAIHCDWADRSKNHGWKIAAPAIANRASQFLAASLSDSFAADPDLSHDLAAVSDTMYDYYAFNWRLYEHAIDPLSPGVIVELGFMSNPAEFRRLTGDPDHYARLLDRGIRNFLAKGLRNDLTKLVIRDVAAGRN